MTEPWALSATGAVRAIRAGMLTREALHASLTGRTARLDPEIRAWARLAPVAREVSDGPLHGVPIAIKDNFDTAGVETTVGSNLLAGRLPAADAAAVARLRAAGAIVFGKTAMTVFAAMDPAPTRNPWNLAHTPGGSSSGSAAAVAAYLVPAAIGSQTAGSILRPASYCGVVGLKPTYGAIDRAGLYPCAWSMDHAGPITRTVEDAALLFEVMSGRAAVPATIDTVGVPTGGYFTDGVHPDTATAFERTLARLRDAGVRVRPIDLPRRFSEGVDAGIVAMYAEMAAVHADLYREHKERYGWKLACLIEAGRAVAAADYLRAQQVRRVATVELSAVLEQVDCMITPTTPAPAPRGLDATGDWRFNLPFSSTGHPALSVPVGLAADGLPIGVQLVARHGGEALLFAAGALIEAHAAFPTSPYRQR